MSFLGSNQLIAFGDICNGFLKFAGKTKQMKLNVIDGNVIMFTLIVMMNGIVLMQEMNLVVILHHLLIVRPMIEYVFQHTRVNLYVYR